MRVCAISGGVGSARFCAGLKLVVEPAEITVVVNTADDERMRGLHVSPDVDTVLYHLAGLTDWDRGWGLVKESFVANDRYRELALAAEAGGDTDLQDWFALGDRDLATHMLRSRLLDAGHSLTDATDALRRAMGIEVRVLPMSDGPVRTMLTTPAGERLDFQSYFVRRAHADHIASISYVGASDARPSDGVVEAIGEADVIVLPPSNPLLSIGPVLALTEIRDAIASAGGVRVAVSPIVGGRALKGPADTIMASFGHEVSAFGVASIYAGLVDAFVIDEVDRSLETRIAGLGMRVVVCDTIMSSPDAAAIVARTVLHAVTDDAG